MLEKFTHHLRTACRLNGTERVLAAVSGGLDSMVMAHLLRLAGWPHGIAHCNFRLRGAESDADEALVRAYAEAHEIPFFSTAFDTAEIAAEAKESIQITARRLRYEWFEQIRAANGYDFIATAHHQDDAAETLLYNLSKGCGIRGLHGIAQRSGYLLRPLLFAGRSEWEAFARLENVVWREDASNQESY
ncbi:MAG TPA: tRNA lysidine(34) synthetase TilS, partial [Saprospiraceae bacterium]|nr:tRNA lysidine(34) synthetase TilS [Saprospiraceae bacterium]